MNNLKSYLKTKELSIYSAAKNAGVPYSTLNDLCNGKVDINNCRVELLKKLSAALNISMDDLYDLCSETVSFLCIYKNIDYQARVSVSGKSFVTTITSEGNLLESFSDKINRYSKAELVYSTIERLHECAFKNGRINAGTIFPFPDEKVPENARSCDIWGETFKGEIFERNGFDHIRITNGNYLYEFVLGRACAASQDYLAKEALESFGQRIYSNEHK